MAFPVPLFMASAKSTPCRAKPTLDRYTHRPPATVGTRADLYSYSGLKQPALAMARIQAGHTDIYEAGTRRERGYIYGMLSIYKDDCMEDPAVIAATAMQESTEVFHTRCGV
jgi:hypothetical protein